MAEYALTNKINLAHERIDALVKLMPAPGDDVSALRDELQKLRGEIQALKMRMGKSK